MLHVSFPASEKGSTVRDEVLRFEMIADVEKDFSWAKWLFCVVFFALNVCDWLLPKLCSLSEEKLEAQ